MHGHMNVTFITMHGHMNVTFITMHGHMNVTFITMHGHMNVKLAELLVPDILKEPLAFVYKDSGFVEFLF
jgi:hypothetical protein